MAMPQSLSPPRKAVPLGKVDCRAAARRKGYYLLLPIPPQSAHYVRSQLPQGDALRHCRKVYRCREKPSPWGRWIAAQRQDGRGSASYPPYPLSLLTTFAASSPKGTPMAMPQSLSPPRKAVPLEKVSRRSRDGRGTTCYSPSLAALDSPL